MFLGTLAVRLARNMAGNGKGPLVLTSIRQIFVGTWYLRGASSQDVAGAPVICPSLGWPANRK